MSALFILLFLFAALIRLSTPACYYSNGTDVTTYQASNNAYAACNASAEASMCCRINISPDSSKDHCRSDGLCNSPNNVFLWRESCTDPTWKSPHCQKLCLGYTGLDPWGNSMQGINVDVTQCDDGSYCCGISSNSTTCCTKGQGVWMVDGKETKVNPNATSSATATNSSATLPAAATGSSTKNVQVAHHNHAGAIAGGVVGGLAALLLLIGLAVYCILRRRGQSRPAGAAQELDRSHTELGMGKEGTEKVPYAELPPIERPYEADSVPRIEMDGGARQEWRHHNPPREMPTISRF